MDLITLALLKKLIEANNTIDFYNSEADLPRPGKTNHLYKANDALWEWDTISNDYIRLTANSDVLATLERQIMALQGAEALAPSSLIVLTLKQPKTFGTSGTIYNQSESNEDGAVSLGAANINHSPNGLVAGHSNKIYQYDAVSFGGGNIVGNAEHWQLFKDVLNFAPGETAKDKINYINNEENGGWANFKNDYNNNHSIKIPNDVNSWNDFCHLYKFNYGFAAGESNTVLGRSSASFGIYNIISGMASFGGGQRNECIATSSIFGGEYNLIEADSSIVLGQNNKNYSNGKKSAIFGEYNINYSPSVLISGSNNISEASLSCIIGHANHNRGSYSFIGGRDNFNNGTGAFVFGLNCQCSNEYAVVTGWYCVTKRDRQRVFGQFNAPDANAVDIVGWGESETKRHNIYTLSQYGDAKFGGRVHAENGFVSPSGSNIEITSGGNISANGVIYAKSAWVSTIDEDTTGQILITKNYVNNRFVKKTDSVVEPTANKIVKRDARGSAQFATPQNGADAATKNYVDNKITELQNSLNAALDKIIALQNQLMGGN